MMSLWCRIRGWWKGHPRGWKLQAMILEDEVLRQAVEIRRLLDIFEPLEDLRREEGVKILLVCDSTDPGPNSVVVVNASWTDWNDEPFYGNTMALALHRAVKFRNTRQSVL